MRDPEGKVGVRKDMVTEKPTDFREVDECDSPAAEFFLQLHALSGAVLLRAAPLCQRSQRTVCANQNMALRLLVLL